MIELGIDGITAVEQIGRGGSATVFSARQEQLDRVVAVKVIHTAWDETVKRRFDRERRAVGRLSNEDGILAVYDIGTTADGSPYIVMPLVENGSLADRVAATGSLGWEEATSLISRVGQAVAVAHDAGVIHCDLKPANILMIDAETPVVADFGLSKVATSETASQSAVASFTPAYSAPESLDPNAPTKQIDVYGLGACLWSLIAGHAPFSGPEKNHSVASLLRSVLMDAPGDLRHLAPEGVCRVIERAMSKDPNDRPSDARTFVSELQAAVGGASTRAAGLPLASGAATDQGHGPAPAGPAEPAGSRGETIDLGKVATGRAALEGMGSRRRLVGAVAAVFLVVALSGAALVSGLFDSSDQNGFDIAFRDPSDPSAQRGTVNGARFTSRDPETGDYVDDAGNVVAPADTPIALVVYEDPPSPSVLGTSNTNEEAAGQTPPGSNGTPSSPSSPTSEPAGSSSPPATEPPAKNDSSPKTESPPETEKAVPATEGTSAPAPAISNLRGTNITTTSARVEFNTNTCTTANYTGTIGTHTSTGWPDANTKCWTGHYHTFNNLQPGTSYSAKVEIRDNQGRATSRTINITTTAANEPTPEPTEPAPAISNLRGTNITTTSARVEFNTNTCTTANYTGTIGTHTSTGWPDANTKCWTGHYHTFNNLQPGTSYTVNIEVRDKQGRKTTRSATIKTTAANEPTPEPTEPAPAISNLRGTNITTTSARVEFNTNTCTTAVYNGSIGSHTSAGYPDANTQCWTGHYHTFDNLQPGTTYSVTVEVRDKQGRATSRSVNITTTAG